MRELKFRAWDKKLNKPLLGFGDQKLGLDGFSLFGENICIGGWGELIMDYIIGKNDKSIDDVVVEQFTGLKDKNGKEIFEGDIVKTVFSKEICLVKFGKAEVDASDYEQYEIPIVGFYLTGKDKYSEKQSLAYEVEGREGVEIIGNIHQNPELLERSE